jgi:hypothetical protein
MITAGSTALLRSFVPVDDHHSMLVMQAADPVKPLSERARTGAPRLFDQFHGFLPRTNDPRSYFMTVANKRNDFMRDPKLQEESLFFGVPFVGNLQDRAMTELMCNGQGEPIYDRTKENLGSSDLMVSTVRKQLLTATRQLRDSGDPPANLDHPERDRVRAGTLKLPVGADWQAASEKARTAEPGVPVAYDVELIVE